MTGSYNIIIIALHTLFPLLVNDDNVGQSLSTMDILSSDTLSEESSDSS